MHPNLSNKMSYTSDLLISNLTLVFYTIVTL